MHITCHHVVNAAVDDNILTDHVAMCLYHMTDNAINARVRAVSK